MLKKKQKQKQKNHNQKWGSEEDGEIKASQLSQDFMRKVDSESVASR